MWAWHPLFLHRHDDVQSFPETATVMPSMMNCIDIAFVNYQQLCQMNISISSSQSLCCYSRVSTTTVLYLYSSTPTGDEDTSGTAADGVP